MCGPRRGRGGGNVTHHRYINLGLGLELAGGGRAGGERDKPAPETIRARALEAVKKRLEGLTFDGFTIIDVVDPLIFDKSSAS